MFDEDKLLKKQFSIQVSRENYIKLLDYKFKIYKELKLIGAERDLGFNDLISQMFIDIQNKEVNKNGKE